LFGYPSLQAIVPQTVTSSKRMVLVVVVLGYVLGLSVPGNSCMDAKVDKSAEFTYMYTNFKLKKSYNY